MTTLHLPMSAGVMGTTGVRKGMGGLLMGPDKLGPARLLAPFNLRMFCLKPSLPLCRCFLSSSLLCRWSWSRAPWRPTQTIHCNKLIILWKDLKFQNQTKQEHSTVIVSYSLRVFSKTYSRSLMVRHFVEGVK